MIPGQNSMNIIIAFYNMNIRFSMFYANLLQKDYPKYVVCIQLFQ